jgi:hypothetical protein
MGLTVACRLRLRSSLFVSSNRAHPRCFRILASIDDHSIRLATVAEFLDAAWLPELVSLAWALGFETIFGRTLAAVLLRDIAVLVLIFFRLIAQSRATSRRRTRGNSDNSRRTCTRLLHKDVPHQSLYHSTKLLCRDTSEFFVRMLHRDP